MQIALLLAAQALCALASPTSIPGDKSVTSVPLVAPARAPLPALATAPAPVLTSAPASAPAPVLDPTLASIIIQEPEPVAFPVLQQKRAPAAPENAPASTPVSTTGAASASEQSVVEYIGNAAGEAAQNIKRVLEQVTRPIRDFAHDGLEYVRRKSPFRRYGPANATEGTSGARGLDDEDYQVDLRQSRLLNVLARFSHHNQFEYHCDFVRDIMFFVSKTPTLPAYRCMNESGSVRLLLASEDFRSPYGTNDWIEEVDIELDDSVLTQVFPGSFRYVRGSSQRPVRGLKFNSPSVAINGLTVLDALVVL